MEHHAPWGLQIGELTLPDRSPLAGRSIAARLAGARLQQSFAVICLLVAGLMLARATGALP